jgi:hypothetical protein
MFSPNSVPVPTERATLNPVLTSASEWCSAKKRVVRLAAVIERVRSTPALR